MALGLPIQLRLAPEKQAFYEEEAAHRGKPLATYLRERLTADDAQHERNEALRNEIGNGMAEIRAMLSGFEKEPRAEGGQGQLDASLLLELVLLMRTLAGPERIKMVHSELKRQGFKTWDGKE